MLALLLVPTMSIAQPSCSQVIQPTQILGGKTCKSKLKYVTADLHNMVQSCFEHLNMNSILMFGAPIIPYHGLNQCVCIADKIRTNFECVADYMVLVEANQAGPILGEYSKECILEGAMGEAARKAFIGAGTDNETKNTNPPATEKKEGPKIEPEIFESSKKPVTWDDFINK